jgi:alpha-tubulin suppressor-like RCC1 family protein
VEGHTGVIEFEGGDVSTCAIVAGGKVWCWGRADHLQLGPTADDWEEVTPVQVPGITGATAISVGNASACALAGGQVVCWGSNAHGQLGTGDPFDRGPRTPVLNCE